MLHACTQAGDKRMYPSLTQKKGLSSELKPVTSQFWIYEINPSTQHLNNFVIWKGKATFTRVHNIRYDTALSKHALCKERNGKKSGLRSHCDTSVIICHHLSESRQEFSILVTSTR